VSQSWSCKWKQGELPPRAARRERLKAGRAVVCRAGRQGRVAADHRGASGCGLAGQREYRRGADARAGPGCQAQEEAQGLDPSGPGPAARHCAPDRVKRKFGAEGINRRWYGDGTEIVTGEGKLYLDSVLDMGSRRIVGFALGEHHDAALAYGALAMAVAVRGGSVPGVVFHTDQGSEYTARTFRQACRRLGIAQSMGRPGSAPAIAGSGSWHSTLEFELRSLQKFTTRAQARAAAAAWIEDYNHVRRHSALGMRSPVDYERSLAGRDAA
jgi:transposase InsO family protein